MKGTDTSELLPTSRCIWLRWMRSWLVSRPTSSYSRRVSLKQQKAAAGAYCGHGLQPLSEARNNDDRLCISTCRYLDRLNPGRLGFFRIGTAVFDLTPEDGFEVRRVQPYEATKTYLCPGCNRDLPPGLGHMVAVPTDAPDLRRHWHYGCWQARHRRRPRG